MTHSLKFFVCLTVSLCTGAALAQTATDDAAESANATSSPIAYVYVSRPTHLDGFAAASDGKLTPVPGSPFSNIAVNSLSLNKKYLFGAGANQRDIYTFSIGAKGAIEKVADLNTSPYVPESDSAGGIQIDFTGSTLYYYLINGGSGSWLQSYKIGDHGELQYLSTIETDNTFDIQEVSPTMISFIGTNKYAYQTGCDQDALNPATEAFKRESSGELEYEKVDLPLPKPKESGDVYCPYLLATDPTDHLAFLMQSWNENEQNPDGPDVLASYTADSHGNLTTKSTTANMPASETGVNTMSISPAGKLLAVGGQGFQVFHFDGSSPITHYTGVLQPGYQFQEFGWDSDNHLYALGGGKLFVYAVTPTSIKEASGSPYSIPESSSVIVLSIEK